jgi:hypothetical protein
MTEKVLTKDKAPRDADYSAAWRACSKVPPGEAGDLHAKLDNALKAGWSIEALKAYAFCVWRNTSGDYVTEAAWRLSVEFADSNGCSGGTRSKGSRILTIVPVPTDTDGAIVPPS